MLPKLVFGLILILNAAVFPKPAEAIVFLPALVLIPIAKIVAILIGGLAIPSLGAGFLWKSLFGGSVKKILLFVTIFLMILSLAAALFLYFQNPHRPLF